MEIKEFKLVADFEVWKENHNPDKLYCIYSPDGKRELFDVYEDDFIEMMDLGIVNTEGMYYLLGEPTDDDIREYAKRWGIRWANK